MFQRIIALLSAAFLFAACETASDVAGESASGSSTSSATGSATASAASSGSSATGSSASGSKSETQMSNADKLAQVGNTVFFGFDSSDLDADGQATLDRQAAFLNVNPTLVVIIEGHADERGTRGWRTTIVLNEVGSRRNV